MILYELIKALRYARVNRELKNKVYLDEATGLPNKNKCEEILTLEAEQNMSICVFDLNNLRINKDTKEVIYISIRLRKIFVKVWMKINL